MKQNRVPLTKQIPVKLPPDLLARLDVVSKRMGEPRSTIMRMAMRLGLASLEKALDVDQPVGVEPSGSRTSSPYPPSQTGVALAEDRAIRPKKTKAA